MKNFKTYEKFLLEFKDNWASAAQGTGAAVSGATSGIFKLASKAFTMLGDAGRKMRLQKLKRQMDYYLETVYAQYLTEQAKPEGDNTTTEPTAPAVATDESPAATNTDLEVAPTDTDSGEDDEETHHDSDEHDGSEEEHGGSVDHENHDDHEHEEEDHDDESDEDVELVTDEEYVNLVWNNIMDDKEEVLNSIPNPDMEEDYKEWQQKLADLFQDIENFADDLEHELNSKTANIPFIKNYKAKTRALVGEIKGYIPVNEAVDWRGDAVAPADNWTDKDRQKVTNKVNPFMIEEIHLKKDLYAKSDKLKSAWAIMENEVYKKWNYVFIIEELKSKSKKIALAMDKPKHRTQNLIQHDYISDKLNTKSVVLSKTEVGNYYLLNLVDRTNPDKNVVLMIFEAENTMFKIIGQLVVKNNDLSVIAIGKRLVINRKSYELVVDEDDHYACIKLSAYGSDKMKIEFGSSRSPMLEQGKDYVLDSFDERDGAKELLKVNKLKTPNASISENTMNRF
jgi:hypothetical protein